MPRQANTSTMRRRGSREDDLPIDFFKYGVVILFWIPGGLLNCINFLRFIFSLLVIQYFLLLFWPCLAPLREELFLAVHQSTERKAARGYAENAEILRTRDYPPSQDSYGGPAADVTDGSWWRPPTIRCRFGAPASRALPSDPCYPCDPW